MQKHTDNNDKDAKELADMIDKLMASGSGHVNVKCDESGKIKADTAKSTDCCKGNMACSIPTLHKGIDDN